MSTCTERPTAPFPLQCKLHVCMVLPCFQPAVRTGQATRLLVVFAPAKDHGGCRDLRPQEHHTCAGSHKPLPYKLLGAMINVPLLLLCIRSHTVSSCAIHTAAAVHYAPARTGVDCPAEWRAAPAARPASWAPCLHGTAERPLNLMVSYPNP